MFHCHPRLVYLCKYSNSHRSVFRHNAKSRCDRLRKSVSVVGMVKSLFLAIARNKAFRSSSEEINSRLSICQPCPLRGQVFGIDVCNGCGCVISAKVRFKSERCPAGLWTGIYHTLDPNGDEVAQENLGGCGCAK